MIEPVGKRYNNTKQVGDKTLILNSENQNHEYVNRTARVISVPEYNNTSIKAGDEIIVHHNVFRRWEDVYGKERNSKAYFKDNVYLVSEDQIFLYKRNKNWKAVDGFSFVQPLVNDNKYSSEKEHDHKGVVVYEDGTYNKGEIVSYTPFSQYEFVIDNVRLFRVYNKFITIKYESKGNEKTYNPSWA